MNFYLVFIITISLISLQCNCRQLKEIPVAEDDKTVIQDYSEPQTTPKSVYQQIAENIAERITKPIFDFLGIKKTVDKNVTITPISIEYETTEPLPALEENVLIENVEPIIKYNDINGNKSNTSTNQLNVINEADSGKVERVVRSSDNNRGEKRFEDAPEMKSLILDDLKDESLKGFGIEGEKNRDVFDPKAQVEHFNVVNQHKPIIESAKFFNGTRVNNGSVKSASDSNRNNHSSERRLKTITQSSSTVLKLLYTDKPENKDITEDKRSMPSSTLELQEEFEEKEIKPITIVSNDTPSGRDVEELSLDALERRNFDKKPEKLTSSDSSLEAEKRADTSVTNETLSKADEKDSDQFDFDDDDFEDNKDSQTRTNQSFFSTILKLLNTTLTILWGSLKAWLLPAPAFR